MKLLFLFMVLVLPFADADVTFDNANGGSRSDYLEKGQVWVKRDIQHVNILHGPDSSNPIAPGSEIQCKYVEWKEPPVGATQKFYCALDSGEVVRIKYGLDNKEIFAEVIASRLFWVLGFSPDEVYSVKVVCKGCPEKNPFKPEKDEKRIDRTFDTATMEGKYAGYTIEDKEDQGWTWKELEKVDAGKGGASGDQVNALVLLAVFVQHGDNKPQQQRIVCGKNDVKFSSDNKTAECSRPLLMVQDLGATFGRADQSTSKNAKFDYELWSDEPIWNKSKETEYFKRTGRRVCIGDLTGSKSAGPEGLTDPVITEGGRKFLADELMKLSDAQIRDLFSSVPVDKAGETIKVDGKERPVTVDDWAAAFKTKRQEIVERDCSAK